MRFLTVFFRVLFETSRPGRPSAWAEFATGQIAGFIPLIIMAASAAAKAIGDYKKSKAMAKADPTQTQYQAKLLNEMNFDPNAPYRRGARSALWASLAKGLGMEKLYGKEFLEQVGNWRNVPGTAAAGGRKYLTGTKDPALAGVLSGRPDTSAGAGWGLTSGLLGTGAQVAQAIQGARGGGNGGGAWGGGSSPGGFQYNEPWRMPGYGG